MCGPPSIDEVSGSPTIGFDVGATKIAAGVVSADGRIVERYTRKLTPRSDSTGLVDLLGNVIEALCDRVPNVRAVGVGAAGLVPWPEGDIEFAANHGHSPLELRRELENVSVLPVVVDNDANVAAWAEASTGRYHDLGVLFLAVGTGIGSGFVVNGHLMRGHKGRGAELGHIVVDSGSDRQCACGLRGCLESVASGRALVRAGLEMVRADPRGPLAQRADLFGSVTIELMIAAALAGDPGVRAHVRTMGSALGSAIAGNVMSLLPVDHVLVGGGLSALSGLLLDPMRWACDNALGASKYHRAPRINLATHGQDSTLVGAGLLAHHVFTHVVESTDRPPAIAGG